MFLQRDPSVSAPSVLERGARLLLERDEKGRRAPISCRATSSCEVKVVLLGVSWETGRRDGQEEI